MSLGASRGGGVMRVRDGYAAGVEWSTRGVYISGEPYKTSRWKRIERRREGEWGVGGGGMKSEKIKIASGFNVY